MLATEERDTGSPADVILHADNISEWTIGGYLILSAVINITPDLAAQWLTERNPSVREDPGGNRRIGHVANQYYRAMRDGTWQISPQNVIAFDENLQLLDGQHRLKAIVQLGAPVEFIVQAGWPRQAFAFIDTGRIRRAAQFTTGKYATERGTAARILAAMAFGEPAVVDRISAKPRDITQELAWIEAWPEMHDLAPHASRCYQAARITRGMHLAVLCMAHRSTHADKIGAWVEGLATGAGLDGTDPRLHLRNRWIRDGHVLAYGQSRLLGYLSLVKTWNAFATEAPMRIIKTGMLEKVPSVVGYRYTG